MEQLEAVTYRGNKILPLGGHYSPETALVVNDYPYGYRLRCKIRYWVETSMRYGQRFVSQTTNPKKYKEVWNTPKPHTYSEMVVMFRIEEEGERQGHIDYAIISTGASLKKIAEFERVFGSVLDDYQKKVLAALRTYRRAYMLTDMYKQYGNPEDDKVEEPNANLQNSQEAEGRETNLSFPFA